MTRPMPLQGTALRMVPRVETIRMIWQCSVCGRKEALSDDRSEILRHLIDVQFVDFCASGEPNVAFTLCRACLKTFASNLVVPYGGNSLLPYIQKELKICHSETEAVFVWHQGSHVVGNDPFNDQTVLERLRRERREAEEESLIHLPSEPLEIDPDIQGAVWRHFKGRFYLSHTVALCVPTMEFGVVYQALYGDSSYWFRPLESFFSEVDGRPRFERLPTWGA